MNEKLLKETLNILADQAILADYDPTPSVRQHIDTNLHIGRKRLDGKQPQARLRLAGVAVLMILLMGVILLLTPPGRGFAQEVIRFFNFAESDVLPLPTGQLTELPPPTRTPAPTQLVELQEGTSAVNAHGAMSYPTKSAIPTVQAEENTWNLTLDEAEQLAGFDLRIPASLAPGYRLDNVIYEPSSGEVIQFYEFHPYSAGEMFLLGQRQSPPEDIIGKSAAVEQITIRETPVEYVEGAWSGDSGLSVETWGGGAPYHTFRWQEGENYFTLVFLFDDSDT